MELRPLAALDLELASDRLFVLGQTPYGNRMIGEIGSATLSGDRITASMRGLAAADWAIIGDDGFARFDIRMVLETHDGALLCLTYTGKANWTAGPATAPIFSVAQIETADERYAWLNPVQIVGQGDFAPDFSGVSYEFFELA